MSDTTEPTRNPIIYDLQGWQSALLEHRRRLFEQVVMAFATDLKHKQPAVDTWRSRLSGPSVHES